jgi:hypothetical protein
MPSSSAHFPHTTRRRCFHMAEISAAQPWQGPEKILTLNENGIKSLHISIKNFQKAASLTKDSFFDVLFKKTSFLKRVF